MRGTSIGTSLVFIATGAILAFAIDIQSTAVDLSAVGAILIAVGVAGLLLTLMFLEGLRWLPYGHSGQGYVDDDLTPPHEHRRVKTTDIVVEDDDRRQTPRVERIRRIRR